MCLELVICKLNIKKKFFKLSCLLCALKRAGHGSKSITGFVLVGGRISWGSTDKLLLQWTECGGQILDGRGLVVFYSTPSSCWFGNGMLVPASLSPSSSVSIPGSCETSSWKQSSVLGA